MTPRLTPGSPEPLGVVPTAAGVNVAVFSAHATRIDLCLFDVTGTRELQRIPMPERTGDVWHGHIDGVPLGARYGLRAHGPYEPKAGHRFNPYKLLLDPFASVIDRRFELHPAMFGYRPGEWDLSFDDTDSAPVMPKAIVTAPAIPLAAHRPHIPWRDTVLYEMNLRGFTKRHPDVPGALRGTFAGLSHPAALKHLVDLGITSVELLPTMAWIDERHLGPLGLTNAWGYNPVALCAPDPKLAPGGWAEIRASIDALHAAGIEVILDVVLNHTGESDELGPTVSLRGLDNASYYRLNPDNPSRYIDDMGCGNCLALDRAPVIRLAMDALRTWTRNTGIDGFRFDLATALGRRPDGFDPTAPLLTAIGQDPELRGLKLIAEPWDIGPGGYQTGRFPAGWAEWNDRFRDTARRYWRGDGGMAGDLATRLAGSADLFGAKRADRSINFITAHDGFTLADLVSHTAKHNEANGEHNRDGTDANHAWNHGVEGLSDDPALIAARQRDQINLIATLLLARGVPMLSMGAEMGHSQHGNNNAYAQDNELSWLDWSAIDTDLLAATQALVALRKSLSLLTFPDFLTGTPKALDEPPDAQWLRPDGAAMQPEDWAHSDTLVLALAGDGTDMAASRVLIALNRSAVPRQLMLPPADTGRIWQRDFVSAGPDTGSAMLPARCVALYSERVAERQLARPSLASGFPPRDAAIDRLADAAGIAPEWWEVNGTHHAVTPETKRALLNAMGLEVDSAGAAASALETLADTRDRRRLPATAHAREGEGARLALTLPDAPRRLPRTLVITADTGEKTELSLEDLASAAASHTGLDGRQSRRAQLVLPPLPAGRYRLDAGEDTPCHLTIAPRSCHRPAHMPRSFGLSAQLYTLRTAQDQGIGDLTTLATAAREAARFGAATFGINPLHALFPHDRSRASPYHPSDRRFLDPAYIDVTALDDLPTSPLVDTMMMAAAPRFAALRLGRDVDYASVSALKLSVLRARFEAFRTAFYGGSSDIRRSFLGFVEAGGVALDRFATFRVIEDVQEGRPWQSWPAELQNPASRQVRQLAEQHQQAVACEMFVQWLADRQLAAAASAASGLPLGLYRDLAVGCAPDGAEAWANRRLLGAGVSVGAPPDPFSALGQVWNLPPPNPLTIPDGGYAGFRALLGANMRHAGMLRIDHVMGLARLFWVPDGASATEGAYVGYPRDALLAELALESARARCMVVGEDLGTVPEGFREALGDSGVLSYRVLWFEREGAGFKPPASYPAGAVACVATHDLPTLAGWWSGADIDEQASLGLIGTAETAHRARAEEKATLVAWLVAGGFLASAPAEDGPLQPVLAAAIHAAVAATPSLLAFAQLEDLAGETEAVNLPGTDRERLNWRRRLAEPVETLCGTPLARAILGAIGHDRGGTNPLCHVNPLPQAAELAKERHDQPVPDPAHAGTGADGGAARPPLSGAGSGRALAG